MKQHTIAPHHLRLLLLWVARLASGLGALTFSLLWPPVVDFHLAPLPALALAALGVVGLMIQPLKWLLRAFGQRARGGAGRQARSGDFNRRTWGGAGGRRWWRPA